MTDRAALGNPYLVHGGVLGTHDRCLLNVSGGRSSGYLLCKIVEAYGGALPPEIVPVFNNTGAEREEALDFVVGLERYTGAHITWIERDPDEPAGFRIVGHNSASRNKEPFTRLIQERQFLPNRVSRFCTVELKIRPAIAFARSLGWTQWASVLGYRADERHRLEAAQKRDASGKDGRGVGYTLAPMVDAMVTRRDVVAFWKAQPFDLRQISVDGKTPEGNCDGCFLKSQANLAGLCRDHPKRFKWWTDMEAYVAGLGEVGTAKTFRAPDRMTHTQIADLVARQGDMVKPLDDEPDGIDCFCTGD